MEFIKMEFPSIVFLAEGHRNSFYEDALPDERVEACGYLNIPRSMDDK